MKSLLIMCVCVTILGFVTVSAFAQDTDGDGVPDSTDNCINYPNGPFQGTCTNSTSGIVSTGQFCTVDADCDTGEFCEKVQADTYPPGGNGCGDACECEGDFNFSLGVDPTDLNYFLGDYGRTDCNNANPCYGDFDCDGDVDGEDFTVPPNTSSWGDSAKMLEDFGRFSYNPCPQCFTDPWCQYTEPTVFPEIATECPEFQTLCPTVETTCPDVATWCPDIPTLCPKVYTQCPDDEFTICPEVPTQCPPFPLTECPQQQTLCPLFPTECPNEPITWCPEIPTECPIEPLFTFCPLNDTMCPDAPTNCPLDWTNCPDIPTVCPDIQTVCPEIITTCPATLPTVCPVDPTNCPTDPTTCPEIPTNCPTGPTFCPLVDTDGDGVDDCNDNCPNQPNGPTLGTCRLITPDNWIEITGSAQVCTTDNDCVTGWVCEKIQADNYPPGGNGIGDACDCEANFNCDLDVDGLELTAFLVDFGRGQYDRPCDTVPPACNGDFTCDGDVDGGDLTKFLEDFGRGQYDRPCPICNGSPWCSY